MIRGCYVNGSERPHRYMLHMANNVEYVDRWQATTYSGHTQVCPHKVLLYIERSGPPFNKKVKFSHTRYRALGPELIPVYRQSARR